MKRTNRFITTLFRATLAGVLACLVLSCASVRENESLFQARAAYEKARTDPVVSANAPVQLEEARQELSRAESADSDNAMTHRSYMAIKKTEIAVAAANEKAAQDEIQRLAKERDKAIVEQKESQLTRVQREARMTQAQMQALEQELAELKARKTERGYVVTLGDILFATNKAVLMPGAQRTIDQVAAFLNKRPDIRAAVQGYTDNVGSDEYNLTLSRARAESVRSAIIARGISPDRISAEGRGKLNPVASNDNAAGRQQNRRVELTFTPALTSSP